MAGQPDGALTLAGAVGMYLKRNYGRGTKVIQEAQNLKAEFYNWLPTSAEKPTGDAYFIPVNVEGNESGRASNEGEQFAAAQSVHDEQFQIASKRTFWPFQVTGSALKAAQSDVDSFARTQQRQQTDNMHRFFSDMNRQCWGQGTGVMTQVNGAVVAGVNIVVDSVQYLRTNQRIDIFVSVGGALEAQNRRITAINAATLTITVDLAVTCSDNAVIVKTGVLTGAPSDGKEFFGAQALVDTTAISTTIQGLSKSTFPVLQATVVDMLGGSITNAKLQQTETGIENKSNELVAAIWSARGQRDKYLELLVPLKRFMNDDAMDSGKRKPVEWNGKGWNVDKDCPTGQIYMLSTNGIEKFITSEPDIESADGNTIRNLPGSDVYSGYYSMHGNLGSLMPWSNGKIVNAAEPA